MGYIAPLSLQARPPSARRGLGPRFSASTLPIRHVHALMLAEGRSGGEGNLAMKSVKARTYTRSERVRATRTRKIRRGHERVTIERHAK